MKQVNWIQWIVLAGCAIACAGCPKNGHPTREDVERYMDDNIQQLPAEDRPKVVAWGWEHLGPADQQAVLLQLKLMSSKDALELQEGLNRLAIKNDQMKKDMIDSQHYKELGLILIGIAIVLFFISKIIDVLSSSNIVQPGWALCLIPVGGWYYVEGIMSGQVSIFVDTHGQMLCWVGLGCLVAVIATAIIHAYVQKPRGLWTLFFNPKSATSVVPAQQGAVVNAAVTT